MFSTEETNKKLVDSITEMINIVYPDGVIESLIAEAEERGRQEERDKFKEVLKTFGLYTEPVAAEPVAEAEPVVEEAAPEAVEPQAPLLEV